MEVSVIHRRRLRRKIRLLLRMISVLVGRWGRSLIIAELLHSQQSTTQTTDLGITHQRHLSLKPCRGINLLCHGIIDGSSIDDMQQSTLCAKLAIPLLKVLAGLPVLCRLQVMRELACVASIATAEGIEF